MPGSTPWLRADQLPNVSLAVLDWLFGEGLLTWCPTALADGAPRVKPLLEDRQTLCDGECQGLDIPPGSSSWVREVYLRGHDRPWVFTRNVATHSTLEGSGFDLTLLDTRSLGELLFGDSAFEHRSTEVCRYPAIGLPAEIRAEGLQGRHSRFSRSASGVPMAEVFPPSLWDQAGAADV